MIESDRASKDEILLVQMKEVWSDIRSYRSNVWQIVGFTLVALSLFFGQVVTGSFSDEFLRWFFLSILLMAFQVVIWEISEETKQRLLTLRVIEENLSQRPSPLYIGGSSRTTDEVHSVRRFRWFPTHLVWWGYLIGVALSFLISLIYSLLSVYSEPLQGPMNMAYSFVWIVLALVILCAQSRRTIDLKEAEKTDGASLERESDSP